jgi:DNA-binding NtrC family response regulator
MLNTKTNRRVLVVDDASEDVSTLSTLLEPLDIEVVSAGSAEQAREILQGQLIDAVVTDLNLPGASGLDLTREIRKRDDSMPVILVTGSSSIANAIEAVKLGASDYLQKPVDPSRLISLLRELLNRESAPEMAERDAAPQIGPVFEGMLGASPVMRQVFARIARVAQTSAPVLIIGESGTGKELVARALHNQSRRKDGRFIPVHTGAIPKELVASELFGHEKGAFTGALSSADGKFEAAEGGTLFLDEVGTMDLPTQISLLRVLETYRFTRVGASKEKKADVRIVAATNTDLLNLVEDGRFREDLYYRLNVFTIVLPPLRDRREDIVPIAERFLRVAAKRYGVGARTLSAAARQRLTSYDWPGNIRELRNAMDQVAVFTRDEVVQPADLHLVPARLARHRAADFSPSIVSDRANGSAQTPPADTSVELAPIETSSSPPSPTSPPPPASVPVPVVTRIDPSTAERRSTALVDNGGTARPASASAAPGDHPFVVTVAIGTPLAEVERLLILTTLKAAAGNKQRAARILGISRRGLYVRLAAYGEHVSPSETSDTVDAS